MEIEFNNKKIEDCISAILVPEKALEEPEYILTFSEDSDASTKHQFHAMTQMAYFQYQDGEIDVHPVDGGVIVRKDTQTKELAAGICIYRDEQAVFLLSCGAVNIKKLLEAAYRFCTRWVRLDI